MKISGALIEAIVGLLHGIGLLQDPQQEVDVRRQLSELEKAQADVWVDFVRATSPNAGRVYVWANSIIALVRPAISTLIVGAMIFVPSRILDLVRTFGEAGPAGWIVMAPVMWWFFGRDVGKVLAMRYGGFIPVGSGAAVPVDPSAIWNLPRERQEHFDRRNEEFDGDTRGPDVVEQRFDRPGNR
jgi:hypothetical protein